MSIPVKDPKNDPTNPTNVDETRQGESNWKPTTEVPPHRPTPPDKGFVEPQGGGEKQGTPDRSSQNTPGNAPGGEGSCGTGCGTPSKN